MNDQPLLRCSVRDCTGNRRLRPGERIETSWSWTCDAHIIRTHDLPAEDDA
jgi:hypothetical protein